MTEVEEKFRELRGRGEAALIGFLTLGDPNPELSIRAANALVEAGIDMLELGLPFSDPIADGPVIQRASERALSGGMTPELYFSCAKRVEGVPKLCLTYYNLIYQYGLESFARACKEVGISGLIVADLPVEESEPLRGVCLSNGLNLIYLVAPTTTDRRLRMIASKASGFLYLVSLLGVTGARERLSEEAIPLIKRVKRHLDIPVGVGFGISKPEHVGEVIAAGAEAIIVGSAFVRLVEEHLGDEEAMLSSLKGLCSSLKAATRWSTSTTS